MNRVELGPLRVIWAYRFWLVGVAVIAAFVAWYLSSSRDDVYATNAQAQVISGRQLNGDFVGQQELIQLTNVVANLARTRPVAGSAYDEAAITLDIPREQVTGSVSVTSFPTLQLLVFNGRSTNPAHAAALADGAAAAFAEFLAERGASERSAALERIQERIDEIELQGVDAATSQVELEALQQSAANLLVRPEDTVRVIQPAELPSSPVEPAPRRDAILAGLGTLILAALAITVIDRLRDRYSSAEEVVDDLRLPLLGELPRLPADSPGAIEAMRSLRTSVVFALQRAERPVLLTTSATPRAGKTYVSTNLARSLAAEGNAVVIIDGDLRRPAMHERLGLPLHPGIGDLVASDLAGPAELTAQAVRVDQAVVARGGHLDAVTAGRHLPDPAEALAGETMRRALTTLRGAYDFVVLDSPPVMAVSDPVVLSRYANGVIVVIGARREKRSDVRRTVATLRAVNADVLGFVFNSSSKQVTSYTYYGNRDEGRPNIRSA